MAIPAGSGDWQQISARALDGAYDSGTGSFRTSGGGGGGGAVTVADGADVTQGAVADAAATAGSTGTVSAKLRRLTADLDSVKTNTTGIATASNQSTANTSLSTIATNTGNGATAANQTNGNQQVQGNVASGAADSGNPVKAGGRYNSSVPTLTNGQRGDLQLDANASLKTTLATTIAGEDLTANRMLTENRNTPTYISTATTTVVKSSPGTLRTIVVQGGTTGTIIGYDNTAASGTILFSFDTTNALATYTFDASFAIGLTVVTSAATKLTVNAR
ncbi:MAG: hypothetical protein LC803_09350 [Acidobacteria bacterium]|nr:hypothetical protein [Acidobacteriota bacterium]